MSKIQIYQKTEGKTKNRNDDFIYAVNITNTRALGILGDFTSDSTVGDNINCCNDLKRFVEGRQEGWRRELTDGKKIIEDVANCVNQWMKDHAGTKSRTTLVAVLYDGYEGKLYYMVQGDSGLAVVGKDGVRYIRKGDTAGTRVAAGFLPTDTGFQVRKFDKIDPSAVIFAYTDGFWENTRLASEEDDRIREIFNPDRDWEGIVANISKEIFGRSRRKDDLSIFVFKGGELKISKNEKTLEEKFYELQEVVRVVNEVSPVEHSWSQKMDDYFRQTSDKLNQTLDRYEKISYKLQTLAKNDEDMDAQIKKITGELGALKESIFTHIRDSQEKADKMTEAFQAARETDERLNAQINELTGEVESLKERIFRHIRKTQEKADKTLQESENAKKEDRKFFAEKYNFLVEKFAGFQEGLKKSEQELTSQIKALFVLIDLIVNKKQIEMDDDKPMSVADIFNRHGEYLDKQLGMLSNSDERLTEQIETLKQELASLKRMVS